MKERTPYPFLYWYAALIVLGFPSFFSTRHYVSPISYLVFRSSSLLYFSLRSRR